MAMSDNHMKSEKQSKLLFDSNVFDVMLKVYKRQMDYNELKIISDNNLVPLLLYENYLNELSKNRLKQSKEANIDTITNIIDKYIDSDIIEQHMYQNTKWSLYDLVTFLRCAPINISINSVKPKKVRCFDKYVFSQLLTKSALKCHYGKKLSVLKKNICVSNVEHIYYIFDCIAHNMSIKGIKLGIAKNKTQSMLNLSDDDMSLVYQYFSQFIGMDKSLLSKIKKTL